MKTVYLYCALHMAYSQSHDSIGWTVAGSIAEAEAYANAKFLSRYGYGASFVTVLGLDAKRVEEMAQVVSKEEP
jgi:hypothetical protein